jgi:A/G-specific adenine glycosylase
VAKLNLQVLILYIGQKGRDNEGYGQMISVCIDPLHLEEFIKKIKEFGLSRSSTYPWRLERDPYHIFIAELLLQRTKARQVVPIYENFIRKFPTIHSLANATDDEIKRIIKPLGLAYRTSRIKKVARIIVDKHDGRFPEQLQELLKLPGVGSYIAGVLLCFAFGKRFPVLDSNIKRVLSRVFGITFPADAHKSPDILRTLEKFFPEHGFREFVIGLLDLGITICLPKNPQCVLCPLKYICKTYISSQR